VSLQLANGIAAAERRLAGRATELVYERLPELEQRYGPAGRARCEDDTALHLRFLASAVAVEEARILSDYLAWLAPLLERFGVPPEDLDANFAAIGAAVRELVPTAADRVDSLIEEARAGG
jgi:hypothetical protein